jgi:two-component system CheB/CheR fusion protein
MTSLGAFEEDISKVMQASPLLMWTADPSHRCNYCNPAGLDFFGHSMEEFSGESWQRFLHPEDRERVLANVLRAMTPQHPTIRQEFRGRRKDGRFAWVLEISSPRYNPEGDFLGYIGFETDITEQKAREAELLQHNQFLREEIVKVSEWEKTRIGRDLHDSLSQSLLGLSLKSALLERKLKKRDLPEFYVAKEINADLTRLMATTRKLSQFLFPITLTQKDFMEALRDLAGQVRACFSVSLSLDVEDSAATFDPEKSLHLYRIIQEAVTNAVRHGRARKISISLRNVLHGKRLLQVRDDGAGIKNLSLITEGMGLHIMRFRARLIGAELEIERDEKKGTLVSCYFTA